MRFGCKVLVVSVLLALAFASCKPRASGPVGPAPGELGLTAAEISSPVPPYQALQTKDPVSMEPIKADFFWDYNNLRVYFASPENRDKFAEDPEKYLDNLSPDKQAPAGP